MLTDALSEEQSSSGTMRQQHTGMGSLPSDKPHYPLSLCSPSVKGRRVEQSISEDLSNHHSLWTWAGYYLVCKCLLGYIVASPFCYLFFASIHVKFFHPTGIPEARGWHYSRYHPHWLPDISPAWPLLHEWAFARICFSPLPQINFNILPWRMRSRQ